MVHDLLLGAAEGSIAKHLAQHLGWVGGDRGAGSGGSAGGGIGGWGGGQGAVDQSAISAVPPPWRLGAGSSRECFTAGRGCVAAGPILPSQQIELDSTGGATGASCQRVVVCMALWPNNLLLNLNQKLWTDSASKNELYSFPRVGLAPLPECEATIVRGSLLTMGASMFVWTWDNRSRWKTGRLDAYFR